MGRNLQYHRNDGMNQSILVVRPPSTTNYWRFPILLCEAVVFFGFSEFPSVIDPLSASFLAVAPLWVGVFLNNLFGLASFFPTCQVRVVRFYVSCLPLPLPLPLPLVLVLLLLLPSAPPASSLSSSSNCDLRSTLFGAGPQPRPSPPSVPCRTSTTTIHAQCSLPDLNHDHPRPVFPAGPQPRPSTPSVPCRTSTTTIHAQCSLPDLNHDHPRPVFPAGPHVGRYVR